MDRVYRQNAWNLYLFMDGKPLDVQNGYPTYYTDPDSGTEYGNTPITCAQLLFDASGNLVNQHPEMIRTVKLGDGEWRRYFE